MPACSVTGMEVLADLQRCARFLGGAARHRARPDDVYISSYPRSGTTWLSLIVHLVRDGDLSFDHISQVVPWYERDLALGRASAADFARLAAPRTFKSHLPHAWLPRGARYVYALRDERDVLVSYYHLYRSHLGYTGTFEAFFERFLRGDVQYGSWFRHVAEFRALAHRPDVLVVEYEAMRRDPARALFEIARHCGRTLETAHAQAILEQTSFASMKALESKLDHEAGERRAKGEPCTAPLATRGTFVREGRVGGFRELLTPWHEQRLAEARAAMRPRLHPELRLAAFLH